MTAAQRAFGPGLKAWREQRGITLPAIAESTKISVALLASLERSDFSRLPGGIFTRAFVRAYATEVGLDPDKAIQDFIEVADESATSGPLNPKNIDDNEAIESNRRLAGAERDDGVVAR